MYLIKLIQNWWWKKILPAIIVVNFLVFVIVYIVLVGDFAIPVMTTSHIAPVVLFTKSKSEAETLAKTRRIYCSAGVGVDVVLTDFRFYHSRNKDKEYEVYARATIKIRQFTNIRGDSFYCAVSKSTLRKSFDIAIERKIGNNNSCDWKSVLDSLSTPFIDYHFIDEPHRPVYTEAGMGGRLRP
ncbi:MAG: hypothetical protein LBH59_06570 [Planctomycetaceae bacterium]|jgi:hypothetical protein|nr:hypothetical protein [Planctomycetaceae bacterium]